MSGHDEHGRALGWARAHVHEREDPPGSNTGAFVRFCQRATWLGGTRWPWCVAFVQRAWRQAGRPLPWLGAGAYQMLEWARKAGWAVPIADAWPGDVIIWNIGAGHASMLAKPYSDTKPWVHTIDGNVSDAVEPCVRNVSLVRGAIHVHETPPAKPSRPPLFEVVTSASGNRKIVYVGGRARVARKLGSLFNRYGGLTVRRRKAGRR